MKQEEFYDRISTSDVHVERARHVAASGIDTCFSNAFGHYERSLSGSLVYSSLLPAASHACG